MTIDIYKKLFGKKGIADGSVIEMAEHGRAGGVSTGSPFKGVQKIPLKIIVDEVDANTLYLGEANFGTGLDEAGWRIKKIVTAGTITTISIANGVDRFDQIWNDRVSLSYS